VETKTNILLIPRGFGQFASAKVSLALGSRAVHERALSGVDSRTKVLVFTTANAADRETTVTSNVVIAAAEIRLKVLVIDADLCQPRIHNALHVANQSGLTALLQNSLEEGALNITIRPTLIPHLHVLPAGTPTYAAAHLLYSPNCASILAHLRRSKDMILIDTPTMLQMTDARVVVRVAEAVVLVARSGQTMRDALIAAKIRLKVDSLTILGTVLNDWNPNNSSGGYYGYYN
jgi:capsular exopolysaccharide synthesis family protein